MSEELEGFFEGLVAEGTPQATGLGFTLESEKARRKLQEFTAAHPEYFQLLALSGLYALGSRHFGLTVDADDFLLEGETELSRAPFTNLWSYASGGGDSIGYRLLALALLTSTRLDDIAWSVASRDSEGCWEFSLPIRSGEPGESRLAVSASSLQGVQLKARRTSVRRVALRYLDRLKDRMIGQRISEERLIRERFFLPKDSSLTLNGVEIRPETTSQVGDVLAVLESGHAPRLFESTTHYRSRSEVTAAIVLVDPFAPARTEFPGLADNILWIWNGLKMDCTPLGAEFVGFRAVVWAPNLQPDLSLSQLITNREKQAMASQVKGMVRHLLEQYVPDLAAEIRCSAVELGDTPFRGPLKVIKTAILQRVSLAKSRERLGALNRILIGCPILIGSDDTGERRWFSFEEIWKELEASRSIAVWKDDETRPLPAFPGRPWLVEADSEDLHFLKRLLPSWALVDASTVERNVEAMLRQRERPQIDEALKGAFELERAMLEWSFSATDTKSRLLLESQDGVRLFLRRDEWPEGITVRTEDTVEVDYFGRFVNPVLERLLRGRLLEDFAEVLSQTEEGPDGVAEAGRRSILRYLSASITRPRVWEVPWLSVWSAEEGLHRISPRELTDHLEALNAPCYGLARPPKMKLSVPGKLAQLRIVVLSDTELEGLEKLLERKVFSASWAALCEQPLELPKGLVWSAEMTGSSTFPQLKRAWTGVAKAGSLPHGESLLASTVDDRTVETRVRPWVYPSLVIRTEWAQGWPGCEGTDWEYGSGDSERTLGQLCLRLASRFLKEATVPAILAVDPTLLSLWTFDLLSEPDGLSQPYLLRADRQMVSFDSLPAENAFCRKPDELEGAPAGTLYLPGELAETVELLDEGRLWREARSTPPEPESAPARLEAKEPELVRKSKVEPKRRHSEPTELNAELHPESLPVFISPPVEVEKRELESGDAIVATLSGDLREFEHEPVVRRFLRFLQSIRSDSEEERLLQMTPEGVLLGRPALKLLEDPARRIYLHSALFSIFNRGDGEVTDLQERDFHQKLVTWASGLGKGRSHSRTKSSE